MGDAFAEDKLIVFMNPRQGYKICSRRMGGLTGVVFPGINEKGITVLLLNASKSDMLFRQRRSLISILGKEILQYAGTICEEARKILLPKVKLWFSRIAPDRIGGGRQVAVIIEKIAPENGCLRFGKGLSGLCKTITRAVHLSRIRSISIILRIQIPKRALHTHDAAHGAILSDGGGPGGRRFYVIRRV